MQRRERQPEERAKEHRDQRPEDVQAEENREPAEDEVKDIGIRREPEGELAADLSAALIVGDDVDRMRLDLPPNWPAADLLRHLSHPGPFPGVSSGHFLVGIDGHDE